MLIAIDGACKRNGMPDCCSSGVAWIQTDDGGCLYKAAYEVNSTNQRGEISGLLLALNYAYANAGPDEDIIIITDSEYLYNTVSLDWVGKWARNNWVGATGSVKNADMWLHVNTLLMKLNRTTERVFMQWTKGHLIHYTPGNITTAMNLDPTGLELFSRVSTVANRPADRSRIISDFIRERKEHDKDAPPQEVALEWAIANTMADCLASYVVKALDRKQNK